MATRQKTVEYSFDSDFTGVAATTRKDFGAITLSLPELASRVIKSAILEISFAGAETTATSLTAWLLGIKLGATAFSDATVTSTLTNTGDQQSHIFTRDVTSYFVTNFGTLAQQTCQAAMLITGIATMNINAKLIITYEFDDTDLLDSGTATSGAATTLTDSGKSWTTDAFIDQYVKIIAGTGSGQVRKITDNDGTSITVAAWDTNPDNTSEYEIRLGHLKTVRIPMESGTASLTNTIAEIGTNQVPLLDTFLPEANKDYKDVFFEIVSNDGAAATTDFALGMELDSEGETSTGMFEQALQTSVFRKVLWKRKGGTTADMDTSAVHAFKLRSNNLTTRFATPAILLTVTYSYFEPDTTSVMNSVIIPTGGSNGFAGGSASGNRERFQMRVMVEEPTTISLKQSGVLFLWTHNAGQTLTLSAGAQGTRGYGVTAGTTIGGSFALIHRIDSGASLGAALTLARGENLINIDAYSSSFVGGLGGMLYLNYTSGKATAGTEAHNKTIFWNAMASQSCSNKTVTATTTPSIPEASYWVNGVGLIQQMSSAASNTTQSLRASVDAAEGKAEGWESIFHNQVYNGAEMTGCIHIGRATDIFKRYPADTRVCPNNYLGIETGRTYQLDSLTAFWGNLIMFITYHSITKTISGAVSGYTGDGSGITVTLHRTDTGEKLGSATTSAGGSYSFTWYDDTIEVFAAAAQDDNHTGRSKDGVAS